MLHYKALITIIFLNLCYALVGAFVSKGDYGWAVFFGFQSFFATIWGTIYLLAACFVEADKE